MQLRTPLVKTAMTPFPFSVRLGATIDEAQRMMDEHGIRHLPVVEAEALVGVVSDRDLRGPLERGEGSKLEVREVCETHVYAVELTERLDAVLKEMLRRRIGSAIVVKEKRVVGIFTAVDACRFLLDLLAELFPTDGSHVA